MVTIKVFFHKNIVNRIYILFSLPKLPLKKHVNMLTYHIARGKHLQSALAIHAISTCSSESVYFDIGPKVPGKEKNNYDKIMCMALIPRYQWMCEYQYKQMAYRKISNISSPRKAPNRQQATSKTELTKTVVYGFTNTFY